jgi:lysozyme family protein
MAEFKKSIVYTLKYEGFDIFTDIPEDAGGATKFGISINFAKGTNDLDLFDLDNDGQITKEDIKLLDSEKALEVYKEYFWDIA